MNSNSPILRSLTRCAVAAAIVGLSACTVGPSNSRGIRGDDMRDWDKIFPGTPRTTMQPVAAAPAPAAAPRAAAPVAAAPAPRSSGDCDGYMPPGSAGKNVTMMAHPTGDPSTSAVLVHQVMPTQVRANTTFSHEIHVTNISNVPVNNVVILDAQQTTNMAMVDSSPKSSKTAQGGFMWDVGDLAPCQTAIITVTSRATTVGAAGNCLVVSYDNNLCGATVVVDPRLEIVKKAPSEVSICDNIPIEFVVKNAGSGAIDNVVIKDAFPAGMMTLDGKSNLELPVGTLGAGESKTVTVTAKADKTGRFDNTATASSGDISATSNKTSTTVRKPVLEITCEPETSEYVGRTLTTRITVRNTGDIACNGTVLTASVPASTSFEAASNGGGVSGGNISWNLGNLAPGATTSVTMDVKANAIQQVTSAITVNCGCADPKTASCVSNVRGIPAVLLEVVDLVDPVEVGTETTYVITVTNQGSADDTNITMTVDLPPEFTFVSCGGDTTAASTGNRVVFTPYARLSPGAKIEWRVVAKAAKAANIRSKFTMTTQETKAQGNIEETESTTLYD